MTKEKEGEDLRITNTSIMKQDHGSKAPVPGNIEDLLTGPEQVLEIAEAVKESDPDANDIDKHIFNRIIVSDEASDNEDDKQKKARANEPMAIGYEMDNFIRNLNSEQTRLKSKSLTTILEMQNDESDNRIVPYFKSQVVG